MPDHGHGRYPQPPKPGATRAAGALGRWLVSLGTQGREAIQRAHDLADGVGGDAGIKRRGLELGVPKQDLNDPDINVLLEQVGGKTVPLIPSSE